MCRRAFAALAAICCLAGMQVRAATLPAGFTETQVVGTLGGAPTAMAFAPDGRLFVCLQTGQLRVVRNGSLLPTPFVSLNVNSSGERGLLGIAFDPAFATNQFVYLYYTVAGGNGVAAHNRVSRFTANGDVAVAGSESVVLNLNDLSTATNHNGGATHFGPDGKLYIAVGENANSTNAQSLSNLLGKMLRINSDGSIPNDNPFYNTATGVNRAIWALGLRNPFTFAFQPGTSRMFINDVGENTWEEIDDGVAGSNYGWPTTEGPTTDTRFRSPIFWYGHGNSATTGIAITGGAFYNPATAQFPASYQGKYFFADFGSGWIRVLDPANNTAAAFASGISSPVDLQVGPDGALYYAARGNGGQIYRVQATPSQSTNISTRARVGANDDVVIGGLIVTGTTAKTVIVRAIGPSLQQSNVPGALSDPVLELRRSDGSLIAQNDNWKDSQQVQIEQTQLAPTNELESAIVASLPPGAYTAVMQGKNGATGIGVVEAYDLNAGADSKLANISTRALVQGSADVAIGGFILGSNIGAAKVVIRGIGPSLVSAGVNHPLIDPTLELHDGNGTLLISNDNWQDNTEQSAKITAAGLAPTNKAEAAIATSLTPGLYTAILAGKDGGTGTGVVELYNLP
jgi:glucose/arabinose dehydrogenase